jgi:resuscitation-promoting factor RpfA
MPKFHTRRVSKAARIAVIASAAGTAVAAPLIGAAPASAASVSTWDKVARCESGGDWHINTGNGYFGGLQFSRSSWDSAGGGRYAPRADLATKDQQIATAQKLLARQGPGAWSCASAGGLTSGGPSPDVHTSGGPGADSGARGDRSPGGRQAAGHGTGDYTVRIGDTLARIADGHHVTGGWPRLFRLNEDIVRQADTIFPGQRLNLG